MTSAPSPLRRLRIRSERVPTCGPSSTLHMPWGRSPSWTDARVSCTGGADMQELDCDFYAFSGHKLFGSDGHRRAVWQTRAARSHAAVSRRGRYGRYRDLRKDDLCARSAQVRGGNGQFFGRHRARRSGEIRQRFDPEEVERHEQALLRRATERLAAIDGLRIYGTTPGKCAIVSFNVEGVHPYDMGMISTSSASPSVPGSTVPNPPWTHFSTTGMCRASFALYNTQAEADALADGVERAVRMLRG